VARVLTTDGIAGFGFSFGPEAFPARDMAAWDATARSRNAPLYALFGKKTRDRVAIIQDQGRGIDPFGALLEEVRSRTGEKTRLVAPNAHPWELSYCAALAACVAGDLAIVVPCSTGLDWIAVSDLAGIVFDWSAEPAFAAIRWHPAQR